MIDRRRDDADFRAARVGNESVGSGETYNFGKKVESCPDGKRDVDQISVFECGSELAGKSGINRPKRLRYTDHFGLVPTSNVHARGVLAQSKRERSSDQTGAENGYTVDDVGGGHESSHASADSWRDNAKLRHELSERVRMQRLRAIGER